MTTPWLQTIHPVQELRRFDLVNPTAAMVHFPAVAHVLARIPRFAGHTAGDLIYSVAQHCVEGAYAIERDTGNREAARAFLLHDGHEYIMGDIATPLVTALDWWDGGGAVSAAVRSLKNSLDEAIYEAAGIGWPLLRSVRVIVKEYDIRMGRTERDERLAEPPMVWDDRYTNAEPVLGCDLSEWGRAVAEGRFLQALSHFNVDIQTV